MRFCTLLCLGMMLAVPLLGAPSKAAGPRAYTADDNFIVANKPARTIAPPNFSASESRKSKAAYFSIEGAPSTNLIPIGMTEPECLALLGIGVFSLGLILAIRPRHLPQAAPL
ncbi:MAG TPA: hypothetical protein VFN77_07240 [Acetobacteraceae bacterium]|nr:hypothetical protein [Acetobacteraceae bacterium]